MMRKLLPAALAIILAFPALAQTATTPAEPAPPPVTPPAEPPPPPPKAPAPLFTIYGTVNANLQLAEAGGATTATAKVKSRTAVSIDSSNLGVRGTYDLPLPLQVVYQCETGASLDGIGGAVLCNRNSRVGLQSAVAGTLFFGNWDTPFKSVAYGTKADDPFLNTDVWGFNGIMGSPGFNYRSGGWSTAADTSTVGFDVRANNSVAWHSPSWAGLSLKAQYSADEFKNASGTQDPTLYSVNAVYDNRYLSVGVAFEQHQDGFALVGLNPIKGGTPSDPASKNATFGATAGNTAGSAAAAIHSTDTAWRVAAGGQLPWAAGTTTLSAMVDQLTLDQSDAPAGALKEYQRLAWQVGLKHRVGDHELRVRYSTADKGKCKLAGGADCSATDYGATFLALGYAYYAAKNTQLYVHYAMLQNEKKAQYTFPIGGSPAVAGSTPAGADPTAIGLGIRYGF